MPSTSVTLTANFQPITNLVPVRATVAPADGGVISPVASAAGYAPGSQVTLTAVPASGYSVDYWYGGACTNFSGTACTFTMPTTPVDVFVRFKKVGGSGYTITTAQALMSGLSGNPLAAGMVAISPNQANVAAGTPVTLTVHAATGYRFETMQLQVNGATVTNLCPEILNTFFLPGDAPPTCTFPMPAGHLAVNVWFNAFAPHFPLDTSVSPQTGGVVSIKTQPEGNFQWYRDRTNLSRLMVEGGVSTTLTARAASARPFIKWLSGPCAGSADPVCAFSMPTAPTLANAEFGDDPAASCTYAVQRPEGYVAATGGTLTYGVSTQAGCTFNADFQSASPSMVARLSKTASGVTLTFDPNTTQYPQEGLLRLHTGREVIQLAVAQSGSANGPVSRLPTLDVGTVGAGEVLTATQAFTLTNPTTKTLRFLTAPVTTGPFGWTSTCAATLAPGASCEVRIVFQPAKAGKFTGEFIYLADAYGWMAPALSGTALATRENVAAAMAGGQALASNRQDVVTFNESAAINGDRRGELFEDQGNWFVANPAATETLELRFAKPRAVERLYLFGRRNRTLGGEPMQSEQVTASGIVGFKADYWTGTTWAPVTALNKVGHPNRWQRLDFAPVTTDRIRVTVDSAPNLPIVVSEAEVWTVAANTTVDAFSFAGINPAEPGAQLTSHAVTPSGFNVPVAVSVSNGSYAIGCTGTFTQAPGTLEPGQSVCVRHVAAATAGITSTTLTVGGRSGTFVSVVPAPVALPADTTPYEQPPQVVAGMRPGTQVQFTPITVSGITAPTPVTVSNGLMSVGCTGAYSAATGTVSNGASICVAHTSASSLGATVTTTLTVGPTPMTFTSVTAAGADPGEVVEPVKVTQTLTVAPGWNLLGNGLSQGIPVADLGSASQIESIWSWRTATRKWAFYSPELSANELAAYASKMGFEVLARIEPNQGFWLKAKTAVALHSVNGAPLSLASNQLPAGWHMAASGTGQTPAELAKQDAADSANQTVSIWAWEPVQKKWFFYAPELAAQGGTVLAEYLQRNGYLGFSETGRKLEVGSGFWVHRAAGSPPSFSLTMSQAGLDAAGAQGIGKYEFISGRSGGAAVKFFGYSTPGSIRVPNRPALQFSSGATFDMWARIDSTVGMNGNGNVNATSFAMTLLAKSRDRAGFALNSWAPSGDRGFGEAGFATYDTTWSSTDCARKDPGPAVAKGAWHRVTAVASATSGTRIYLNKRLVAECPGARPSFTSANGQDLYLGQYGDGAWYPLEGALQDLRVYQRALTPAEVESLP